MNVDSCEIKDMDDGTYEIDFKLPFRGPYQLRFLKNDKSVWKGFDPVLLRAVQGDTPSLEFEFDDFKLGDSVIQFKVKENILQQKKNRYVSLFLKNPTTEGLSGEQKKIIEKLTTDKWKNWMREHLTNLMNTMDLEKDSWGDYEKRAQELLDSFYQNLPFLQKGQATQFVSINDEQMDWTHYNQEKLKEFTKTTPEKPKKDLGKFTFDFVDPNAITVRPRRYPADFWTWIRSLIVEAKQKPGYKIDKDGNIRLYFDQHIVVREYVDKDSLNLVRVRDIVNYGKHQMSVAQRFIFEILQELNKLPDYHLAKNTLHTSSKLIFAKMKKINDTFVNYSKRYGEPQDEATEKMETDFHDVLLSLKREYLMLIKNMNEGFQDILKNELKLSKEQILDISLFSSFYKFDLNELQKGWLVINGYELSSKDRKIHVYEFLFENQFGKLSNSYEILVPINQYFDSAIYKGKLSLKTSSDRARTGLICPFKMAYIKFNHVLFEAIRTGSLPGIDAEDSFTRRDIASDNAMELLTALAANHAKRFSREELKSLNEPLRIPITSVCLLTPFFFGKREDRQTFEQQQSIIDIINGEKIKKVKVDLHDFLDPLEIRIKFENPTFLNFGTNAIIKTLMMGSGYQRVVNARKWGMRSFMRKINDFQHRLAQRNAELRQQMIQYFQGPYFNTREGILYRENFTKLLINLDNTMKLMNEIVEKNRKKVNIQEAKILNLQNKLEKKIVEDWLPSFDVITSVEFQYLSKIKGQVNSIISVEDTLYQIESEHKLKYQEIVEVEYSLISQLTQTFSAPEIVPPTCWQEYFELSVLQKDIYDLFTDLKELYHDREHEKFSQQVLESSEIKDIDSFSIPVRILLLSFHIGEQTHFNCKSGKDRTGMMAEHCLEFVELHAEYGEYPRVRAEKEKYNKHRQQIQQTLSMNGSTLDITQMNQGIPGSKIDQSMSGRFQEGWYRKYRGLSKLGKVKFATKDEWYKYMK
jgi:rubrerythrin